MNKSFKMAFDVVFIVAIILLVLYFLFRLLGVVDIYEVKTGSMEDGIHAGDYILIIKKNNYKVGDVVTYKKDGYHVTHRIIKKYKNKVITKGDVNNIADEEISTKRILGKVIYSGKLLNVIIDYKYVIAAVLFALYLLSCYIGKEQTEK